MLADDSQSYHMLIKCYGSRQNVNPQLPPVVFEGGQGKNGLPGDAVVGITRTSEVN